MNALPESLFISFFNITVFKLKTPQAEPQNFFDPVLSKPESQFKAMFLKYRSGLNIIEH